jgi:uncharacterized protein YecE (DUF72 family)
MTPRLQNKGLQMGEILVGTCSWTDPTLIKSGRFYPASAKSAEARLQFYASQFQLVEVDSTYYAMPNEATAKLWVERTSTAFTFDIKAFRLFTMHPTPLVSLPKDIREALPKDTMDKKNIYQKNLPPGVVKELWERFERALLPLDSAGKLGIVLFQFPPWYYPGDEQRDYMLSCKEKLSQYRIAIEFRHNSWVNEKNRERTLAFLRDNKLPFVCVDEPQGFKSSVPPVAEITSDISLVRFHGRNRDTWEKQGIGPAERFNYLYSEEELREWTPKIRELADKTKQCHVLFNNCYEDKAVVNARQVRLMFD